MNKTFLIFKHEFFLLLKKKGFIIMTLIIPLLALGAIGVMRFVSGIQKPSDVKELNIGYVDEIGQFRQYTTQGNIKLIPYNKANDATEALVKGDINEYLVIPADYISTGQVREYSLQGQLTPPDATTAAIENFLVSNLLAQKVPQATVDRVKAPLNLTMTTLTSKGSVAPEQGGLGNLSITIIFSILFALSMIFSSTYMLQGLGGEKENRIMEILLSSVSTRELLVGKVLGLSAAGLVQAAVWVASLPLLLNLASSTIGGAALIHIPTNILSLGIVYFILGYLLFATLAASVGAISPTTQEAQQLSGIYSVFALVPIWGMALLIKYPYSPVWTIFTIFPLTSPVLVMERLGMNNIAIWEIVVSIAVLALSVTGGLLLSAKVFRVYLLMYGKRPKLRELIGSLNER